MAQDIRVKMKQFNGTDFDEIYPNSNNGIMAKIIITPNTTFTSIKATSPSGVVYNGEFIDGKWIIEVGEYGEYTIQGEGSEPESKSLIVDTCKVYEIEMGFSASNTLNDNSWEIIRKASDLGKAESIWAIGDAKQITINGDIGGGSNSYNNYKPWVYILGFNHNSEKEGNNKIHFGCFRSGQNYSLSNGIALDHNNYGSSSSAYTDFGIWGQGWDSCLMRTTLLNANASSPNGAHSQSFLSALPTDLKEVLKLSIKYTSRATSNGNNYIVSTEDWVWLLSEFEVFGTRTYANSYEQNYQKQYDYYKNGNSKIKYRQREQSTSVRWWLRSPDVINSSSWCAVNTSGSSDNFANDKSYGVAPGFCV